MFPLGRLSLFALLLIGMVLPIAYSTAAYSEDTPSLTLEQAFQAAIINNPDYQATLAQKGISEAQIKSAAARLNPAVLSDNGVAEKTYRLGIQQTIELGGKRKNRVLVAQAQKSVALAEMDSQLLELRWQVRKAYTQLYIAQEQAKARQEVVRVTEQLLKIAEKREALGDIARLDVLGARISFITVKNDYQTALYQTIESRNQLSKLLYKPLSNQLTLSAPDRLIRTEPAPKPPTRQGGQPLPGGVRQDDLDLDSLIRQAIAHRPEVLKNRFEEQVARQELALARSNRIPNLNVAAGPDLVIEPLQRKINVFVIGTMDIPVFNRQQGPIEEALGKQKQLAFKREALKNRITFEVLNAHINLLANSERIRHYEGELLPDSDQVVRLSMLSFREGKAPILFALQAQQAYQNIRLGYLEAVAGYQNAVSDLEKAVGTGL